MRSRLLRLSELPRPLLPPRSRSELPLSPLLPVEPELPLIPLLPVVPEGRATGDVRFRQRLKPGAGLGQYLRLIDTLMKDRR